MRRTNSDPASLSAATADAESRNSKTCSQAARSDSCGWGHVPEEARRAALMTGQTYNGVPEPVSAHLGFQRRVTDPDVLFDQRPDPLPHAWTASLPLAREVLHGWNFAGTRTIS
ncbi:hypothetical protein GCM10009639_56160 [Kitasatospora putterlickiae]|uniref:Uncharacterized protein n=1 Tax=Kitasatospora putterlickiae TaxID=221725 RepID=A0ABN1YEA1_9ACTN